MHCRRRDIPWNSTRAAAARIGTKAVPALFCASGVALRPSIFKRWRSRGALSSSRDALFGTCDGAVGGELPLANHALSANVFVGEQVKMVVQ